MFKSLGLVLVMAFFVSTACAESVKQQKATASSGNKGTIQQRSVVSTPKEARMDTNNDGRVGRVEANQARAQVNTPKEARMDRNNDGTVDKTEALQARSQVSTPKEARMDTNNDGVVDETEANQFRERRKARLDTNKDGVVDEQEKIQARSIVDTPEEAKFDKNGDGVIDATEAKDFLKARQARLGPKGERVEANNTVE